MPVTYNLIASNTLTSSAASVTFSSIPNTYTDLVLRVSARRTDTGSGEDYYGIQFNGTSANYSMTTIRGDGSSASSLRDSTLGGITAVFSPTVAGVNNTANTFSTSEVYIPSYLASQNKPISVFGATENNSTAALIAAAANLWRNTAAITSLTIYPRWSVSGNFASGSSFFLYGIKNS